MPNGQHTRGQHTRGQTLCRWFALAMLMPMVAVLMAAVGWAAGATFMGIGFIEWPRGLTTVLLLGPAAVGLVGVNDLARRWPRCSAATATAMPVLLAVIYVGLYGTGHWAYQRELERWESHGLPTSWQEWAPPDVAEAENAANDYARAHDLIEQARRDAGFVSRRYMDLAERERLDEEFPFLEARFDPEAVSPEKRQALLEQFEQTIALTRRGANKPGFDAYRQTDDWADFTLGTEHRPLHNLLRLQALEHAEAGDFEQAEAVLVDAARFIGHFAEGRSGTEFIHASHMTNHLLQTTERLWAPRDDVPQAVLDELRAAYGPSVYRQWLIVAAMDFVFDFVHAEQETLFSNFTSQLPGYYGPGVRLPGSHRRSAAAVLGDAREHLELVHQPMAQWGLEVSGGWATSEPSAWALIWTPMSAELRVHEYALSFAVRTERRMVLAETAQRLREHRSVHGSYPDHLSELDGSEPTDPIEQHTLNYHRFSDGGFLLELDGRQWRWD